MSAASHRTCGRRNPNPKCIGEGTGSRAEQEAFRKGLHDFERRHGRKIISGSTAHVFTAPKRIARGQWHAIYLAALARSGEHRQAALSCAVPYGTVLNALSRQYGFRHQCQETLAAYVLRQLQHVAAGRVKRWTVRPKTAALLLSRLSS